MSGSFSEKEARQIFARAAERQHAVEARGEGLSLEELQAIGREAGLDPNHVAAAVADLRAGPAAEPVVVAGINLTPRRERVLPVEMTDAVWEEMVARLRRTFGSKGVPSEIGRIREWTSGPTSHLHVIAEPVEGGTRVVIESSRVAEAVGIKSGPAVIVALSAAAAGLLALGTFDWTVFLLPLLALVAGLVMVYSIRWSLRRWSERRSAEFDRLMDQFELMARTASTVEAAPETPRLNFDALVDPAPEPDRSSRPRTRS